jgi:hypothetical protein
MREQRKKKEEYMTVQEFFSIEGNKEAYQAWIKDPVTKSVLDAIDVMIRPIGMATPTSESALYLHGLHVGMSSVLDIMKNLEKLTPENLAKQSALPSETYGMEATLRELGYNPDAVQIKDRR